MKVFKQVGSKERFLEVFQNVNKVRLNEAFGQTLNPQTVLAEAFDELKNGALKVKHSSTQANDNESYVELLCVDNEGNNITFTFKALVEEGDQEGVFDVKEVGLETFAFDSASDEESVELSGDALKQFNAQHQSEMLDMVDEYMDVEEDEPIDTLYEDAVKLIDKVPYKAGSEKMVKHQQYADEKPTNPEVRVTDAEELKKFVKENEYPEGLGKEFKPESQSEYAKKTKAEKKRKSKKVKIKEYYSVLDTEFNREHFGEFIGKTLDSPIPYAQVKVLKEQYEVDDDDEGMEDIPVDIKAQKAASKDIKRSLPKDDVIDPYSEIELSEDEPDENDGMSLEPAGDEIEQLAQEKEMAGDLLQGGKADTKSAMEYDPEQIKKGLEVEKEHTDNPLVALEIATDHLEEFPDYYTRLDKMEKEAKAEMGWDKEENGEEKPSGEEDKELTDELLGYKPKNVGDEMNEEFDYASAEVDYENKDALQKYKDYSEKDFNTLNDDEKEDYFELWKQFRGVEKMDEAPSKHVVVFDGTSAFVEDEANVPSFAEVIATYDNIDDAQAHADELNNKAGGTNMNEGGEKQLSDYVDAPGSTEIWYMKPDSFGDLIHGFKFIQKYTPEKMPDPNNLEKTHILLGTIAETDPEAIFHKLNNWSGNELLDEKGLSHTSMSVGDIIKIGNKVLMVDDYGFKELSSAPDNISSTGDIAFGNPSIAETHRKIGDTKFLLKEAKEIVRKNNVQRLQEMAAGNKTKMFKIGEYAVGGIIKVDIDNKSGVAGGEVAISALDWNTKQPVQGTRFVATNFNGIDNYLNELTSSYYAGKIMEWIKGNLGVSSKPDYFSNQNW